MANVADELVLLNTRVAQLLAGVQISKNLLDSVSPNAIQVAEDAEQVADDRILVEAAKLLVDAAQAVTLAARDEGVAAKNAAKAYADASGAMKVFDTFPLASAALGTIANNEVVRILVDGTHQNRQSFYRKQAGVLVFKTEAHEPYKANSTNIITDNNDNDFVTPSGAQKLLFSRMGLDTPEHLTGAKGDGITNDTAALQAAHNLGIPLQLNGIYSVTSLVAKVPMYGKGKIIKRSGTGTFITTGVAGLTLDIEIDCNGFAGTGLSVVHDRTELPSTAKVRNSGGLGIHHTKGNDCVFNCKMFNCKDTFILSQALTENMTGLRIYANIDGRALGITQTGGGIKAHGSAQYALIAPDINAVVRLFESASMGNNTVCLETLVNVIDARIAGIAEGGSIGCSLNDGVRGVANVQARGNWLIGLEMKGSPGGQLFGSVSRGTSIAPNNGVNIDQSPGGTADVSATADNVRDGSSAVFYANQSPDAVFRGRVSRTNGGQYVRIRDSKNVDLSKVKGTTTILMARAILLEPVSAGGCDGLIVDGCYFPNITSGIQVAEAVDRITICGGTVINNTNNLFAGGGVFSNVKISPDVKWGAAALGTRWDTANVLSFNGAQSLCQFWGTGAPEGYVSGAIGSEYYRRDGAANTTRYLKETNPTNQTGWVAK